MRDARGRPGDTPAAGRRGQALAGYVTDSDRLQCLMKDRAGMEARERAPRGRAALRRAGGCSRGALTPATTVSVEQRMVTGVIRNAVHTALRWSARGLSAGRVSAAN